MRYKALKTFNHDQLGRVEKDSEFTAEPRQMRAVAGFVVELDEPATYETKVIQETPKRKRKNKE